MNLTMPMTKSRHGAAKDNAESQRPPSSNVSDPFRPAAPDCTAGNSSMGGLIQGTPSDIPLDNLNPLLAPHSSPDTPLFGAAAPMVAPPCVTIGVNLPVNPLIPPLAPPAVAVAFCPNGPPGVTTTTAPAAAVSCDCYNQPSVAGCPTVVPCAAAYISTQVSSGCRLCDLEAGCVVTENGAAAAVASFVSTAQTPSTSIVDPLCATVDRSGEATSPEPESGPTLQSEAETGPTLQSEPETESKSESQSLSEIKPEVTRDACRSRYDGPFSDPVYKKLSRINGEINKMSYSHLKERLTQLGMDNRGFKDVLKKRLKLFYKKQSLVQAKIPTQAKQDNPTRFTSDYLIVIDFEATCEEKNYPDYPHEIIEFPAIIVDVKTMQICDTFHSFVRPELKPKLSNFCKTLTGIKQETVDDSPFFEKVLQKFEDWLKERQYFTKYRSTVVTDGPWDMCRFMVSQCKLSRLGIPAFSRKWCNIRKVFSNFYGTRRLRLVEMLFHLGLPFEGQPHSGLDDAKNIATVAMRLLQDGAMLTPNEKMQKSIVQQLGRTSVEGDSEEEDDDEEAETLTDTTSDDLQKENLSWALQMVSLRETKKNIDIHC